MDVIMTSTRNKRKRAEISYAEVDDELDALIFGEDHVSEGEDAASEDEDVPLVDDDADFRKKVSKTAIAKRRAKKARTASTKRHKKNEKAFPFLLLPRELRDMIYEYALTDNQVGIVAKTKAHRRTITRSSAIDQVQYTNAFIPALLAVNKQINNEAATFLYRQPFIVEDTYALHSFLATIGPGNCAKLSDITVKAFGGGRGAHKAMNFAAFVLLSSCTNLESLMFDAYMRWHGGPKLLARTVYREGFHFLQAYGTAKGDIHAAVSIIKLSQINFSGSHDAWRHSIVLLNETEFELKYQEELKGLLSAAVSRG